MKRQDEDTESRVYRYGVQTPTKGLDEIHAESERMKELWDRLVDIERETERIHWESAAADSPAMAEAVKKYDAVVAGSDFKAIREAERATWAPLSAWRKTHKEEMKVIELERRAKVVKARQGSPAWWPNYNAVVARYEAQRVAVRKAGRRLRHSREEENGTLNVQIQGTKTGLGAAADELQNGTLSAIQIKALDPGIYDLPRSERRRRTRVDMEMRIDRAGTMLRAKVTMHRPLPPNGRIKAAQLVWRREGTYTRYYLCLVISRPRFERPTVGQGQASIRIQWTPQPDGSVLVADGPLPRVLPARWLSDVRSARAAIGLAAKAVKDGWVRVQRPPGLPKGTHYLTPEQYEALKVQHDGADATNRLRRLLGRRNEEHRLWARAMAMRFAAIRVQEDDDRSIVAQIERGEDANSLRVLAATFRLIAELKHQATEHGSHLDIVAAPLSPEVANNKKLRKLNKAARAKIAIAKKEDGPRPAA